MQDPGRGQREWIESHGFEVARIERLTGDVSQRRYSRAFLAAPSSAILAEYPAELRGACSRFESSSSLLEHAGVRVPRILASDCARGLMLLEDLGTRTLFDLADRRWTELEPYFERGLGIIEAVQSIPSAPVERLNPPLDRELLERELRQTWDVLLDALFSRLGEAVRRDLRTVLATVCERLAGGPRAVCHRDFMGRNLTPVAGGDLGVLDHQDLRMGPRHYDLASFMNDSLFAPVETERRLLDAAALSRDEVELYRCCAVQRTLKAAGTFAAFARRGFDRHLVLIPPTLARAAAQLRLLPEGAGLAPEIFSSWENYRLHGLAGSA